MCDLKQVNIDGRKKEYKEQANQVLNRLGINELNPGATTGQVWLDTKGDVTSSVSPIDGEVIAKVSNAGAEEYESVIARAEEAFEVWKTIPAPRRGEVVRQIGMALRESKEDLGFLVSLEMGKIYQEGLGEVQEMIDICDFAVGQSRQLYGFTMQSERPLHRMYDQYHPLGIVGLVTAFNFPVAVWAWNAMIAAVAGDVVLWKPSSKTPLTAIAIQNIISKVLKDNKVPEGVFNLVVARSVNPSRRKGRPGWLKPTSRWLHASGIPLMKKAWLDHWWTRLRWTCLPLLCRR